MMDRGTLCGVTLSSKIGVTDNTGCKCGPRKIGIAIIIVVARASVGVTLVYVEVITVTTCAHWAHVGSISSTCGNHTDAISTGKFIIGTVANVINTCITVKVVDRSTLSSMALNATIGVTNDVVCECIPVQISVAIVIGIAGTIIRNTLCSL
jgi:hypothetical protein